MKVLENMINMKDRAMTKVNMMCIGMSIAITTAMMPATAYASDLDVSKATTTITDMIASLLSPLLTIVGAVGTLYCVLLGVKFAKAEEPQEREKAKTHLKNAIIGFVLIFVLIVALKLMMPQFEKWVNGNTGLSISTN